MGIKKSQYIRILQIILWILVYTGISNPILINKYHVASLYIVSDAIEPKY